MNDDAYIKTVAHMTERQLLDAVMENPEYLTDSYYRTLGNAYRRRYEALCAAPSAAPSAARPPRAWMRKWAADGEKPYKERNAAGRLALPFRFKLLPITPNKLLPDDVPLYANQPGGES